MKAFKFWWYRNMPGYVRKTAADLEMHPLAGLKAGQMFEFSKEPKTWWLYCGKGVFVRRKLMYSGF